MLPLEELVGKASGISVSEEGATPLSWAGYPHQDTGLFEGPLFHQLSLVWCSMHMNLISAAPL